MLSPLVLTDESAVAAPIANLPTSQHHSKFRDSRRFTASSIPRGLRRSPRVASSYIIFVSSLDLERNFVIRVTARAMGPIAFRAHAALRSASTLVFSFDFALRSTPSLRIAMQFESS